ncbi:MAG: FAD-dependent oxidoreductase [Sphaerochaetaceae bacterium]
MINNKNIIDLDLCVIGAGPAGLAAATEAKRLGIKNVVVFDRDEKAGGILAQCIHPGFGLQRFKEELTGPEYAHRELEAALKQNVEIELNSMVIEIKPDGIIKVASAKGLKTYRCKSIILAMGCRERTRSNVRIPGTRPAGIFTAGKAQRLVNIEGFLPGRKAVIIGSGDIGMIMARRLILEGCQVEAIIEINSYTSGLIRNEVQCIHDFNIPLLLSHQVTMIRGDQRVEEITVAQRDSFGKIIPETEKQIACDTILLSVGLIPENELSRNVGITIDNSTKGPLVDNFLATDRANIFACGNVLHVNDLVDEVSFEGELAAKAVAAKLTGNIVKMAKEVKLTKGANIGQIVPQQLSYPIESRISIRVKEPTGPTTVKIGEVLKKRLPFSRPGEMIVVKLTGAQIEELAKAGSSREVSVE